MLRVVADKPARAELSSALDDICREGARRMLAAALEAEVDAYVAQFSGELDDKGHRLVTRNGHAVPRVVTTAAGTVGPRPDACHLVGVRGPSKDTEGGATTNLQGKGTCRRGHAP